MRDYGKVYTSFWTSEDIVDMSEDGRTLAFYLLTCPHGNMLGCFRLPNAYAAEDLKWDIERVSKGFDELISKGYIYRCNKTSWVFISRYLKWNQFENPNVGKAAGKLFESITPPHPVKAALAKALREFSTLFPVDILDEFETLQEPFNNPSELISKTGTRTRALTRTLTGAVNGTDTKNLCAPKNDAPTEKEARLSDEKQNACRQTWEAYSSAYLLRYGAAPVRNAKVNRNIVDFVGRLGYSESPHVASFFLTHNNAYYVREMHAVGAMLRDCEKLRTEWATRRQMTATEATQADKTQTNMNAFQPLIDAALAEEARSREENYVEG